MQFVKLFHCSDINAFISASILIVQINTLSKGYICRVNNIKKQKEKRNDTD